jgi:hypothetical protein
MSWLNFSEKTVALRFCYNPGMNSGLILLALWAGIHLPIIALAAFYKRSWTDLLAISLLMFTPALVVQTIFPPWGLVVFLGAHLVVPVLLKLSGPKTQR